MDTLDFHCTAFANAQRLAQVLRLTEKKTIPESNTLMSKKWKIRESDSRNLLDPHNPRQSSDSRQYLSQSQNRSGSSVNDSPAKSSRQWFCPWIRRCSLRSSSKSAKVQKGSRRTWVSESQALQLILYCVGLGTTRDKETEVHSLTSIILSSKEKAEEAAFCISLSTSLIASKRLRACNWIRVKNVDSPSIYQGNLRCLRLLLYR